MTRFHMADDQRDLVAAALGDEWKREDSYESWTMERSFPFRDSIYLSEFQAVGRYGYVEVVMNTDWASFCREELEQVLKVIVEVEDRLRAAGLQEVAS